MRPLCRIISLRFFLSGKPKKFLLVDYRFPRASFSVVHRLVGNPTKIKQAGRIGSRRLLARGCALQNRKQCLGVGVIAERTIQMHEQIAISGPEDEAGTELEGIAAKLVLSVTGRARTSSRYAVVATENVKEVP